MREPNKTRKKRMKIETKLRQIAGRVWITQDEIRKIEEETERLKDMLIIPRNRPIFERLKKENDRRIEKKEREITEYTLDFYKNTPGITAEERSALFNFFMTRDYERLLELAEGEVICEILYKIMKAQEV